MHYMLLINYTGRWRVVLQLQTGDPEAIWVGVFYKVNPLTTDRTRWVARHIYLGCSLLYLHLTWARWA